MNQAWLLSWRPVGPPSPSFCQANRRVLFLASEGHLVQTGRDNYSVNDVLWLKKASEGNLTHQLTHHGV